MYAIKQVHYKTNLDQSLILRNVFVKVNMVIINNYKIHHPLHIK